VNPSANNNLDGIFLDFCNVAHAAVSAGLPLSARRPEAEPAWPLQA
jgi:hypothetical protein